VNDVMLYARLKDLGMPANTAWDTTAYIRDKLHPVAAVAAAKILQKTKAKPSLLKGLGSTQLAMQGASAGATIGSAVPVIGTAIGAAVGAVVGALIHQGQGAQRAAFAQSLDQALSQVPTSYVGRTLPWSSSTGGLEQFISALMTTGVYMNWDPSLLTNPSVNGNWSVTFVNAIKALTNAIINNPTGNTVSVPITFTPGANVGPGNFTFVNPGINVGPDAISAQIVMGPSGLMYWMIKHLGETDAHAQANAYSPAAQKVFALMIDKATADALPASLSTSLANAPIVQVPAPVAQAAAPIVAAAVASGTVPQLQAPAGVSTPTTLQTVYGDSVGNPIDAPINQQLPATSALTAQQLATAGLMQQLLSQGGANFTSANATQLLADIAANGVEASPQGPPITNALPSWLLPVGLIGGGALLLVMLLKK
jgi:Glycine zipper